MIEMLVILYMCGQPVAIAEQQPYQHIEYLTLKEIKERERRALHTRIIHIDQQQGQSCA